MTPTFFARPLRISLLPLLLIIGSGCTTTITRQKAPVFAVSTDTLQVQLGQLVSCEHFNVDGKEITTNGKAATELEIDVINGKRIPEEDTAMKALARAIALDIKKALRDPSEYESYKVLFYTVTKKGGVTMRQFKGQMFKAAEL